MTEQSNEKDFEAQVKETVDKVEGFLKRNQTKLLTGAVIILSLKNRGLRRQNTNLRVKLAETEALVDISNELIQMVVGSKH